ncbi:hypothetical protein E2562_006552 [Oryza meyeriana var. granulata]|uniref:Uncharacterized protein n=1 Tax=Oryza meyeriana var. granulata TaxID=110450 RepID=A0A6G1BTJ2_9ORYZ|nr:hypothetical protein E2562_006552 [Oryza meyeriana var. granulata]
MFAGDDAHIALRHSSLCATPKPTQPAYHTQRVRTRAVPRYVGHVRLLGNSLSHPAPTSVMSAVDFAGPALQRAYRVTSAST